MYLLQNHGKWYSCLCSYVYTIFFIVSPFVSMPTHISPTDRHGSPLQRFTEFSSTCSCPHDIFYTKFSILINLTGYLMDLVMCVYSLSSAFSSLCRVRFSSIFLPLCGFVDSLLCNIHFGNWTRGIIAADKPWQPSTICRLLLPLI